VLGTCEIKITVRHVWTFNLWKRIIVIGEMSSGVTHSLLGGWSPLSGSLVCPKQILFSMIWSSKPSWWSGDPEFPQNHQLPPPSRQSLHDDALPSRCPRRALRGRLLEKAPSMEPLLCHGGHCDSALCRKLDCYPPEVLQTCLCPNVANLNDSLAHRIRCYGAISNGLVRKWQKSRQQSISR
jgi:hypothetical protein